MKRVKIRLINEINEYCEYNKIDVNEFVNKCIEIGFNISKYGYSPIDNMKREKNIIENKNSSTDEKKRTTEKTKESVLHEVESAKEEDIVNEDDGKHEEQIVEQTEQRGTEHKEEIKSIKEDVTEVKPKKRRVKIIKN